MQFFAKQMNGHLRDKMAHFDAEYALLRCEQCGLIYQRDVPNEALMKLLYDEWRDDDASFKKSQKWRKKLLRGMKNRAEIRYITSLIKSRPIRSLDVGMGWGYWAAQAANAGFESAGTELSPRKVAYAKEHGVSIADGAVLTREVYDYINTEQVFEHVADPDALLRRLDVSLKPGGVLKFSVPNAFDIDDAFDKQRLLKKENARGGAVSVFPLIHLNGFTHASIRRFVEGYGYELIEPEGYLARAQRLRNFLERRPMSTPSTYLFFKKK